jgi:hypothetical protein
MPSGFYNREDTHMRNVVLHPATSGIATLNALETLAGFVEAKVTQATDDADWVELAGWLSAAGILYHAATTLRIRVGAAS